MTDDKHEDDVPSSGGPDWAFAFVDGPGGVMTVGSVRPPTRPDRRQTALLAQLRTEAERLEADVHAPGATPDLEVQLAGLLVHVRELLRTGLTIDEIADHASLSLTALTRWLDRPRR